MCGDCDAAERADNEAAKAAEPAVEYRVIRHAAHYTGWEKLKAAGYAYGHDLHMWSYQQDARLPCPSAVQEDAEYHSGFIRDGKHWWTWTKAEAFTDADDDGCARCRVLP